MLLLVDTACASTNQRSRLAEGEAGVTVSQGAQPTTTPVAAGEAGTTTTTEVVEGTSTERFATTEEGSTPVQLVGKGVTASTVTVGIQVPKNLATAIELLGASTTAADNLVAQLRAIEDWINANGGVAGRDLRVVIHETDPTVGTFAEQSQQTCVTFTEDNEVAMAASTLSSFGADLASCLADNGTPMIAQNSYPYDETDYARLAPYLYQTSRWEANEWHRAYIEGLHRQGFFDDATIGLVRFDAPVHDRISANAIHPTLQRLGLELTQEIAVRRPGQFSDFAGLAGALSSAILKFKNAGVDRVLFMEEAGAIFFFWLPAAESSGYYPRYGLSSALTPYLHARNHPDSMHGAVGLGWSPIQDVNFSDRPDGMGALDHCIQIMRDAGLFVGDKPWSGSYECDDLFFMKAVLDRATDLTPDGIARAVAGLGTSYDSTLTFSTRFAPGRPWGVSSVRPFAFDEGCRCFRYSGEPYAVP